MVRVAPTDEGGLALVLEEHTTLAAGMLQVQLRALKQGMAEYSPTGDLARPVVVQSARTGPGGKGVGSEVRGTDGTRTREALPGERRDASSSTGHSLPSLLQGQRQGQEPDHHMSVHACMVRAVQIAAMRSAMATGRVTGPRPRRRPDVSPEKRRELAMARSLRGEAASSSSDSSGDESGSYRRSGSRPASGARAGGGAGVGGMDSLQQAGRLGVGSVASAGVGCRTSRWFNFTGRGGDTLVVEEDMRESNYAFDVPHKLLLLLRRQRQQHLEAVRSELYRFEGQRDALGPVIRRAMQSKSNARRSGGGGAGGGWG